MKPVYSGHRRDNIALYPGFFNLNNTYHVCKCVHVPLMVSAMGWPKAFTVSICDEYQSMHLQSNNAEPCDHPWSPKL